MSKYFLVVNGGSGKGKQPGALDKFLEATRQKQPDLEVHLLKKGDDVQQLVRKAIKGGAVAVGAAGGDGTVNSVASALVGTKVPLVVIPFGTLNHFARDLGITITPEEALSLFESDRQEAIDVGEVNGYFFLNNSSVGLYPTLVKQREKYEKRLGKWLAYTIAGWTVLRHPRLMHVQMQIEGRKQDLKAGIIFFSNNRAEMTPLAAGHRDSLTDHVLDTYIVKAGSFFQFLSVAGHFVRNRLDQSPLVTETELTNATVYSHQRYIRVACDGEVFQVAAPLRYRVRSASLLVRLPVPPEEPQQETDAPQAVASR